MEDQCERCGEIEKESEKTMLYGGLLVRICFDCEKEWILFLKTTDIYKERDQNENDIKVAELAKDPIAYRKALEEFDKIVSKFFYTSQAFIAREIP